MKTIEWQAGNGSKISVELYEHIDLALVDARIDGKRQFMDRPALLDVAQKIGEKIIVAHIGNIGLTQDQYDVIKAGMEQLQSEIDSRPEVRLSKLIKQRENLAANIGYILDAAHEDHYNRIEMMSANGFAANSKRDYEAEEKAAREELAAFDAAHPEVIEKIKSDKEDRINRFLAAD